MSVSNERLETLLREYLSNTSLMFCPSSVPHGDRVQVILLIEILKELKNLTEAKQS